MKPFLIMQLRPEDETADNEYEAILQRGGLTPKETERIRIEQTGIPELDLSLYSGIIVGGSPFDISTPEAKKSPLQKNIEADFTRLLTQVIERDFPFLGACSGNGLLGNHCGSTISKQFGEPVGGVDISLTEAGKADPLLAGLPDTFRVLVGHKEACDTTPPGAVLLASSTTCPVQMFRVGENVYATQFHPEADPSVFIVRINVYRHHDYFEAETAEALIEAVRTEDTPHAHTILRRFIQRFASNT
ncbi:glutamine amidotransferase [Candidatus Kaiserbacteria bacterium]|nr:glutamine amidotransferase [Candidatus Kaiserbacteria bacterium]MCB9812464.1 glutamine amidotransferase [Candidatus Nomurabacteria bacterium]